MAEKRGHTGKLKYDFNQADNLEVQLKTITDYLKTKNESHFIPKASGETIKAVVKENIVKIINDVEVEDEYEEIEVTDDEADE